MRSEVWSSPSNRDIFGYIIPYIRIYIIYIIRIKSVSPRERREEFIILVPRAVCVAAAEEESGRIQHKSAKTFPVKDVYNTRSRRVHGDILLDILFKLISFKQNTSLESISINTATAVVVSSDWSGGRCSCTYIILYIYTFRT